MSSAGRTGRHAAVPTPRPVTASGARGGAGTWPAAARWVGTLAAGSLLLVVVAALAAVVVVPRLTGASALVVLTGSMAPGIPAGSVVVVRPVDVRSVDPGDVVTYEVAGSGELVTHRVVGVGHDAAGQVQLTTQGDANDDADLDPVPAADVRGELWYSVPYVGLVSDALRGSVGGVPDRVLAMLVAGAALAAYAVVQVVGIRGQRRRACAAEPLWTGRTASRELLVATLDVSAGDVDVDALDRLVEDLTATVLATTDTTVSLAVTAAPALIDDAVASLTALAPVRAQRSGALHAPLGPGSPVLTGGRGGRGRTRGVA